MYFDIVKANYIAGYKIELIFEDGKSGVVNLENYATADGLFSKFLDRKYFQKFYIDDGILTWGKGEIDIAPETLYLEATGAKTIEWDNEHLKSECVD